MSTHTPATWGTRLGFILASAGSAVGLGAIWKFPYMAGTNGGSVFMLPYIFFTLTVGVALLLAEFAMGRAGRRGAVGSLNRAAGKPWGIFGGIGVFTVFLILSFYSVVGGWCIKYLWDAMLGIGLTTDAKVLNANFGSFVSDMVSSYGYLLLFLCLTAYVVMNGVQQGIEKIAKILMPLLFTLMVILIIRGVTLPGGWAGVEFLFTPRWEDFNGTALFNAMGFCFFSLSLGALRQVIQPVQQVHQSALAGAGAPQNGKGLPLVNGKGHVLQHRLAVVGKADVVKDDVAVYGVHGVGQVPLLPGVEDIAHAVHGHPGLAHIGQHPAQGTDGPGQSLVIGDEGHKGAQGHPPGHAFAGAGHHDDHHLQAGQQGAGGPVYGQELSQPDPQLGEALVFPVELLLLIPLPAEGPDHPDGGEVLLGAGGQVALRLVGGLEAAGDFLVEHTGGQAHNGDEQRRDQGQAQVHGEHDA